MGIFRGLLATIFGNDSAPQGLSEIRDERRRHVEKNRIVSRGGDGDLWRWRRYRVHARTKSEARAKIKAILREEESCKFLPQQITRLPVGAVVERVKQ